MSWLRGALPPPVVRGCQLAIALVFGVAALAKIGDLRAFAAQIHNFRLTPLALDNLLAIWLPWVELVLALALLSAVRTRAAALLAFVLMALFTGAVGLAMARGLDIECGCFGTADASRVGARKLLENMGLLVLAWIATRPAAVQARAATRL
ncbi:MAG TPA: MauE/DoxX family redox-associated membrane protein [Candidatus Polarisedimenticolaceae bacterium]|nr:MauE/DoxX family redox-associated membrane protein [Candidatus Polarisedimenticolaceae bacterium]